MRAGKLREGRPRKDNLKRRFRRAVFAQGVDNRESALGKTR